MAATINPGIYVPTTNIWDVQQLYSVDVNSPEFKELLVRLYQNINNVTLSLNAKDSGYYIPEQFVNGQLYFPNPAYTSLTSTTPSYRQVYRLVVNFGALPNTGTKSVAHNITIAAATTFTRIYATASDTSAKSYIPIPYASPTAAKEIEINVDATNVNIITGNNRSAYTICYVVLEYIQG